MIGCQHHLNLGPCGWVDISVHLAGMTTSFLPKTPSTQQASTRKASTRQRPVKDAPPVALAHAVITATGPGILSVTLDGEPVAPPEEGDQWSRSRFGELVDVLTDGRRVPVRIEVHETDGTTFTDIIHVTGPQKSPPATNAESQKPAKKPKTRKSGHLEVTGVGFTPGEVISAAVITTSTEAAPDGTATVKLPRNTTKNTNGGRGGTRVILVGRASGRILTRRVR